MIAMKPLILIDGIKSRGRNDVALALAKHFICDVYRGEARTSATQYMEWLSHTDSAGVVIESSWQTQRVGKMISPSISAYERGDATLLSNHAKDRGAITVHVTSFVETTILSASVEQHSGSLTTEQLNLLFRAIREWEFPDFVVRPVVTFNPHAEDFVESLYPQVEAALRGAT